MAGVKGRSGRLPKPTKLLLIEGTYRSDRHKARLDKNLDFKEGKVPPPPADIEPKHKEAWEELAATISYPIFTIEDITSFHAFAAMWAVWKETAKHVAKHGVSCLSETKDGRVVRKASPEAALWMDLNSKLLLYFARFGLTPADRARMRVPTGGDRGKQEDPDDEFASSK